MVQRINLNGSSAWQKEHPRDTRVEVPQYEIHEEAEVDPAKTALIVVDMQNDFVKEGGALVVPDAEATIPAIQGLLNLARESGMKIVFTQDTHNEGDPEWEIWPEHVREDSWGWQIVDELRPLEGELVVRKVRYAAFYGTHLDHFLRTWDVDTLSSAARSPTSACITPLPALRLRKEN